MFIILQEFRKFKNRNPVIWENSLENKAQNLIKHNVGKKKTSASSAG